MMKQTVRNFSSTFVSVIIGLKASKLHRFVCLLWIQLGMQFVQWTTSTQINKLRFCLLCFLTWVLWKRSDLFGLVWFKIENSQWRYEAKYQITTETKMKKKNHSFSLLLHIQKKKKIGFFFNSIVFRLYVLIIWKDFSYDDNEKAQFQNVSISTGK